VAKLQDEKGAMLSIHYALEVEKIHEALYGEAKNMVVASGSDIQSVPVFS
jgi:hypothetical protein